MKNKNKYCLPTPDAFSFDVKNNLLVPVTFGLFDTNGINADIMFQQIGKSPTVPVKGVSFFGNLTPASIKAFTKEFPIKLSAIQIEFQSKYGVTDTTPQNIPVINVEKANIDGSQVSYPLQWNSKRTNKQFQANTILIETDLIIDGNTGFTFDLDKSNAFLFTFFIDEILTC